MPRHGAAADHRRLTWLPLLLFEAAWTRVRLGETRAHRPMLMARSRSARSGSAGELQIFEEGKQGVGCPVAAGVAVRGCDAVKGALLERQVGVQVDVRGALLLVAEPERDRRRVDPGVEERHRGGVAQHVHRDAL